MNRFVLAAVATTVSAGTAVAGGLDRSGQSVAAIFDPANTLSFGLSYVQPDLTGADTGGTGGSYDAGGDYANFGWSFTNAVNDRFSYAIIGDQPFGADILYNDDPTASNLGGTKADLSSNAVSFIGKYRFSERFSLFGGLRAERAGGEITLNGLAYQAALGARGLGQALSRAAASGDPLSAGVLQSVGASAPQALAGVAVGSPQTQALEQQLRSNPSFAQSLDAIQAFTSTGGYDVVIEQDWGLGLTFGAAYEIPEIALRLAVTYHSEVTHDTTGNETSILFGGTTLSNDLSFASPQSVNIEFQTGIAEDTLLLAGLRWADWGDFDVIPKLLGSDLANIDDSYRWSLGVARRFNENLVGLATIIYEKDRGTDTVTPLGPTDGQIGVSLGARYTSGNLNISGGINYTKLGDAYAGVANQPVALFEDNSAIGIGLKVAYEF
ncbi:OmpP1/FadL family transporter [Jannaschia seohaensis]|uniref:Long-chain fatty acid transport protein n=1 Tax=Jannaschia seohaensis TaxID=475081 RepID=A0A2Y9C5J3_9RHOB|nr:outer membrane protein transport protein [Jannaschia seohaensis]PWJ21003.1 long-subunit fatty acid transport protein [Jannaschia seohaensis]SSA41413.1 Long-chain fatty acid transport protein [Jannaschia seohaensis]